MIYVDCRAIDTESSVSMCILIRVKCQFVNFSSLYPLFQVLQHKTQNFAFQYSISCTFCKIPQLHIIDFLIFGIISNNNNNNNNNNNMVDSRQLVFTLSKRQLHLPLLCVWDTGHWAPASSQTRVFICSKSQKPHLIFWPIENWLSNFLATPKTAFNHV